MLQPRTICFSFSRYMFKTWLNFLMLTETRTTQIKYPHPLQENFWSHILVIYMAVIKLMKNTVKMNLVSHERKMILIINKVSIEDAFHFETSMFLFNSFTVFPNSFVYSYFQKHFWERMKYSIRCVKIFLMLFKLDSIHNRKSFYMQNPCFHSIFLLYDFCIFVLLIFVYNASGKWEGFKHFLFVQLLISLIVGTI